LNGEPSGSKSKRWYAAQQLKMVKKGEQGDGGETSADSSSPSDEKQPLSESDDSSETPRNMESEFVGRPVSVVSTWFGSQWSRARHGLDRNVLWYTGKSLSWDPKKKRYLVGCLEGDAVGKSYEMNLQCEIEGNSAWEKLGQPDVGGVTSSVFPPRSLAPTSPDIDAEGSGVDHPSQATGDSRVQVTPMGALWMKLIEDVATALTRLGGARTFPYDDNSCNLDSFLLAELAAFAAHPDRLLYFDIDKVKRTNELCRTLASLAVPEGMFTNRFRHLVMNNRYCLSFRILRPNRTHTRKTRDGNILRTNNACGRERRLP
jgi:hypothetical protein